MSATPLSYPKFRATAVGTTTPLVGGLLYTYVAGTTTALATYTDSTLGTPNTNPVVLDSSGEASIWATPGVAYKFVLKDSGGSTIWTLDNVTTPVSAGTASATSEWTQFSGAPTYVSATSFTVTGDQTATFIVGGRLKSTNTGGTIYSTIRSATFSSTVTTVVVSSDSGSLDSGMSVVFTGILSPTNISIPVASVVQVYGTSGSGTLADATSFQLGITANTTNTVGFDLLTEYTVADGKFTAKQAGKYRVDVSLTLGQSGVTWRTTGVNIFGQKNGSADNGLKDTFFSTPAGAGNAITAVMSGLVSLAASDYLTFGVKPNFSAGTPTVTNFLVSVVRVDR